MAIRFRRYRGTNPTHEVTAIRLTEKNVEEVVAYVTKNRGTIIDETRVFKSPDLKDGQYTAVKVALVQKNAGSDGRVRSGVRKAFGGDLIVREEVELKNGKKGYEFYRIRDAGVDGYTAV